jgi:hypothetical protein
MAAFPRSGELSGSIASTAVSTRETKKLATECTSSIGCPCCTLRSSPRMKAQWMAS